MSLAAPAAGWVTVDALDAARVVSGIDDVTFNSFRGEDWALAGYVALQFPGSLAFLTLSGLVLNEALAQMSRS